MLLYSSEALELSKDSSASPLGKLICTILVWCHDSSMGLQLPFQDLYHRTDHEVDLKVGKLNNFKGYNSSTMTIYKKTEILEGFWEICNWDNEYMCTNIWMHIYTACSEQLSLLQVQSQTETRAWCGRNRRTTVDMWRPLQHSKATSDKQSYKSLMDTRAIFQSYLFKKRVEMEKNSIFFPYITPNF